jgi:hypothetical protein
MSHSVKSSVKGSPYQRNAKGRRSRSGLRYQSETKASCDESGVGFSAHLTENSTPLWSHHTILRSDETWLPEWNSKHAEVTVPSLDDWEKEWGENSQRSVQLKLVPVDFRSPLAAIAQLN